MFPLTLTLLIFFTILGLWLLIDNSLTKRFSSIIVFFICFILIVSDNWIYILIDEVVSGTVIG